MSPRPARDVHLGNRCRNLQSASAEEDNMAYNQPPDQVSNPTHPGRIVVSVSDGGNAFTAVQISVYQARAGLACGDCFVVGQKPQRNQWTRFATGFTAEDGSVVFDPAPPAAYLVVADALPATEPQCVQVESGCSVEACFDLGLQVRFRTRFKDADCRERDCGAPRVGDRMEIEAEYTGRADAGFMLRVLDPAFQPRADDPNVWEGVLLRAGHCDIPVEFELPFRDAGDGLGLSPAPPPADFAAPQSGSTATANAARGGGFRRDNLPTSVGEAPRNLIDGRLTVSHQRRVAEPDGTMSFFVRLIDASRSLEFGRYVQFIDSVLCSNTNPPGNLAGKQTAANTKIGRLQQELTDHGVGAYELLKTATEAFLLARCCVQPTSPTRPEWPLDYDSNAQLGDYKQYSSNQWRDYFRDYLVAQLGNSRLPYIQRIIDTAFPEYDVSVAGMDQRFCADVLLKSRVDNPCFIELIWNYWHEEGMLVQGMNAVSRRFQNLHAPGRRDPLAHMEIDPLRPLNNILWGYVEDERGRLSIKRRGYEYQHQYGLNLYGKAVADLRPADNRSKFIEAFHNLLNRCADYYRAKQDTTVDPDGYPILHAIQELNLILAQGAHNQFGDLAWTSRVEMLMQQWIMARPEMRDFLQSRPMVPYKEAWMPQVDTMKTLQGWTDVVVTHFRDLGVYGEQILLTIRWYNWYDVTSEEEAKAWADLLRAQIQTYIHAYRAVTGVDLSSMDRVDYGMPSLHLRKRLAMQHRAR
jgi:hypothetical protein